VALSGTIKDFGLGDIFQLIGIQRKTGVLTLESESDSVTVKFLEGQVVGADTRSASVEDLLGAVLVRTGRIKPEQLKRALALQKQTLQRLGFILVKNGFISEEELVEALRVQSLQIVYRLFRWRAGKYNFARTDDLDYDQKHFAPISAETILMEGARMIDEWPIIERRIRSDDMVVRRTAALDAIDLEAPAGLPEADLDFDFVFDQQAADEKPPPAEESAPTEIELSAEERHVLRLVDGKRNVTEINDHANLGQFDTYRLLADLMTRKLIEEVKRPNASEVQRMPRKLPERVLHLLFGIMLAAFSAAAFSTLAENTWTPWQLGLQDTATETLHQLASRQRLERIERGLEIFYLDRARFPVALAELTEGGYLRSADLRDPWGRPYGYEISAVGFRLGGYDAEGRADQSLLLSHRFTGVQRMMMAAEQDDRP
jgi:hypothetical protein